jgi:Ca2+-binding RTX toxin-like protein
MKLRSRALWALTCGCLVALAVPAAAPARAVVSRLHVEAGGQALAADTTAYVNNGARVRTKNAPPACNGSRGSDTLRGPTALGLLDYADNTNRRLRPLEATKFDFGTMVCGLGGFRASGADRYWLVKVNHADSQIGGAHRLRSGDEVLWYLVDNVTGQNTGQELVLEAPARAVPGETVSVRVLAFTPQGVGTPAPGASVAFGQNAVTTGPDGRATFTTGSDGRLALRATRGNDIPASPLSICVNSDLAACPSLRGLRIVGTNRPERLFGGAGGDTVVGRGGNDRIDIRRGDIDRADCGGGRDVVFMSRGVDRADRDCERVIRR